MEKQWEMFELLDPVQLGFVYESLMKNAGEQGLNSKSAEPYLKAAEEVKEAIESNCGFADYEASQQGLARKLADYDGRMGWRD